ncbi:MAG TPA: hypothetical protein VGG73_09860 [Vicinamibacterales bacterium]
MAVELQIESRALSDITTRALQSQLNSTCFPAFGDAYLDHANVVFGPLAQTANAGAVQLLVPVDLFIVLRTAVLAAPNSVPAGATSPAGRVTLHFELRATGTAISLKCMDVDLGSLGPAVGLAAKAALIAAVGSPLSIDLSAAFTAIGLPAPATSRVEIAGSTVAIRFDPAGGPLSHLFPGFEWGLFLDGPAVERLAVSKVPADFRARLTGLQLNAHWRPAGSTPHVDVDYSGKVPVPDPFTCGASGTFGCDFGLTPGQAYRLRTTVHWSLHLELGDFVPGLIENLAEDLVAASVDPAKFGGVPLGDHGFALDSQLPAIKLGGSEFRYSAVLASPAGMTIGGPVKLPLMPSLETVELSTTVFGLPFRTQFCSQLAKSGSGAPIKSITINDVTTNARIFLENAGNFCGFEVISPGAWINSYIFGPAPGTVGNTHDFYVNVPGGVSGSIKMPARLIVNTARGVRLAELGVPPKIVVDANGQVTNAHDTYIDDCLYIDPNNYGLKWGHDDLVIPLEHPDWSELITSGLDVQLVTLNGLERGELVQFRSAHHQIDVTADQNGRAMVPVLLPLTSSGASAQLMRSSRRPIAGHVDVQSAICEARASLATAPGQTFSSGAGDTARLTSRFSDRVEMREIGTLGLTLLENRPLNREVPADATHSRSTTDKAPPRESDPCDGLPGVMTVLRVPGFEDTPIAIALMKDGAALVMDLANRRRPRVAGTFNGPIGAVQTAGNWALASAGRVTSIYRVSHSPDDGGSRVECSCVPRE